MHKSSIEAWLTECWQNMLEAGSEPMAVRPWLALLAGHARSQPALARRMAIIEVLSDDRPHRREELQKAVEARLGPGCFGQSADQTLWVDMRALRRCGLRIGYSRRPGAEGYFLEVPAVEVQARPGDEEPSHPVQTQIYRSLSSADKMRAIFEMFEFALHQARVGTRRRHPDWDDAQVEAEARRLVTGSKPVTECM